MINQEPDFPTALRKPAYAAYYLPPDPVSASLIEFGQQFSESQKLSMDDPVLHVTMGYGFKDEHMAEVFEHALREGAITLRLGELRVFHRRGTDKQESGDYVVMDAHNPKLHCLYDRLQRFLPPSSRPYHPHITLALLKPGKGATFAGDRRFEGQQIHLTHITFIGERRDRHTIALPGGATRRLEINTPPSCGAQEKVAEEVPAHANPPFSHETYPAMNLRNLSKSDLKAWADGQSASLLPENADLYFHLEAHAVHLVAIESLLPTRDPEANPKSVHRAMIFAQAAGEGRLDKRRPLTVRDNGNATFTILDGVSTLGAARRSGWKQIPVIVDVSAMPEPNETPCEEDKPPS